MANDRASNLGSIFNAGKTREQGMAQAKPEAMPYFMPDMTRETELVVSRESRRDTTMELTQDPTVELTQETTVEGMREPVVDEAPSSTPEVDLVVSNVAVYLPVPVLDRLKASRAKLKRTYTDLLIDAFDELADAQILEALGATPRSGGMPRRHRGPARGQGGVQVQLRLDQEQRDWLDERVKEYGAPSRSALVAAVFDAWLPKGR